MIGNLNTEKKLNTKINEINTYDSEDIYAYPCEFIKFDDFSRKNHVEREYNKSIERIKQFEEKAKANLVAISISVTIMFGLVDTLNQIYEKYNNLLMNIILSINSILIIFFMLYGGIIALKVLMEKNIVYKISVKELQLSDESLKKIYGMDAELNEINNTIRNNYINTSYKCIRNALILLCIIFILGVLPINNKSDKVSSEKKITLFDKRLSNLQKTKDYTNNLIKEQNDTIKKLINKLSTLEKQFKN
ncbi:hypothetical protein [Clostridium oceanicum]|uniref:Uncharacterized protein n=1 Tax=Clostridium oceanicum TaxID=1543 RepID=A0ABN1JCC1_9CLOT